MKNYKVKATRYFKDLVENVERTANNEFMCDKERYEFLKDNNAVELVEIVEEEKPEINSDIKEIPEKKQENSDEKPKKKKTSKK